MGSLPQPAELLAEIVRQPSPSGHEEPALQALGAALERAGFSCQRHGRNLVASFGTGAPRLWLCSHIDTVKPAEGYTFDPHCGTITEDGRVLGLGANDAKGSVVAMACALAELRKRHAKLDRGTVELVVACDEETGGEGVEWLRPRLPKPDAVIIGEPNDLAVATACKGLVRAFVDVHGKSAHASRPWQGVNAIRRAVPVLQRLCAQHEVPADAQLGRATLEVTMIQGGHQKNALPALVTLTLDARTTPAFDNARMTRLLHELVDPVEGCNLRVASTRLQATRTDDGGRLVAAALAARAQPRTGAFDGVCDFVHVGDCDALIMGPGAPVRSHRADEYLEIAELEAGVAAYAETLERYYFPR